MCVAVKESIWLSRLLADLQATPKPKPIALGLDINGAIETAKNASVNQSKKHIDLKYHFVRDAHQSNLISLRHVASENQIAESLTKPLDRQLFTKLRGRQGLCSKAQFNSISSRECCESESIKLAYSNLIEFNIVLEL